MDAEQQAFWEHLQRVRRLYGKDAADALRRAHNRPICSESNHDKNLPVVFAESVSKTNHRGEATAVQLQIDNLHFEQQMRGRG